MEKLVTYTLVNLCSAIPCLSLLNLSIKNSLLELVNFQTRYKKLLDPYQSGPKYPTLVQSSSGKSVSVFLLIYCYETILSGQVTHCKDTAKAGALCFTSFTFCNNNISCSLRLNERILIIQIMEFSSGKTWLSDQNVQKLDKWSSLWIWKTFSVFFCKETNLNCSITRILRTNIALKIAWKLLHDIYLEIYPTNSLASHVTFTIPISDK